MTTAMNRREAIGAMSWPVAALAAAATLSAFTPARTDAAEKIAAAGPDADDECFWAMVAGAFTVDRSIMNLNNGGVSPSPRAVQEAMRRHLEFANSMPPPVALWQIQEKQREGVRQELARSFGADPEEIAITRNASEGLQICQFGFDLSRGDEVLCTNQDYPRMINTFKQREKREGVVLKEFALPIPCEDPAEVVRRFEAGITPRTKLILMSHMVNLTGQVLPVRAVAEMARKHGIPVIVDGAHAFAHIPFKLSELGCDYYATSLHKWLFAPHGTGLLYVRRDKIKDLWPLMAAPPERAENIRKFEEIGTHPEANTLAISEAVTFHNLIGAERKAARMVKLRKYWMDRLTGANPDRVRIHTPSTTGLAFGVGNFEPLGVDPEKLQAHLWDAHRILVTTIKHEDFKGIRVTPSIYTTFVELDRFCDAVEAVLKNGLPA